MCVQLKWTDQILLIFSILNETHGMNKIDWDKPKMMNFMC